MKRTADPKLSELMTATEAAIELGVTIQAIYMKMKRGQMQRFRLGSSVLVLRTEVEALQEEGKL